MRNYRSFFGMTMGVFLIGAATFSIAATGQETPAPSSAVRAPGDPVKIERGKKTFTANCSVCHGADARGGEVGPNLVRSQRVLDDKNGELISDIVKKGYPERGMPPIAISDDDIADVVAFLHSLQTKAK